MTKRRVPVWFVLTAVLAGLVAFLIPGLRVYMSATAQRLHRDSGDVPSVIGAAPPPEWTAAVKTAQQVARATMIEERLTGLSAAVGVKGEVVWAEGFGYSDVELGIGVTPNQRFRIGTASEALTSAAAGLLLESGSLKLDAEIQHYLPAFPKKQAPITVRQLMSHSAGIRTDGGDDGPLLVKHCESPRDALADFANQTLASAPGTRSRFSIYGWVLISAAIEAAAGQPFLPFLQERVLAVAGMPNTAIDPRPNQADIDGEDFPLFTHLREIFAKPPKEAAAERGPAKELVRAQVTSYFPRFAADTKYGWHIMRPLHYSCYAGSSALTSTPSDMVRFAMALNNGKLLKRATVDALWTPQKLASGEETRYGLGWSIETVTLAGKPTRKVGSAGILLGGPIASLMIFPQHDIVVAVTSNISYTDTEALGLKIAAAFASEDLRHQ